MYFISNNSSRGLKKTHNINFSHVWPQRVLVIEFKGHNLVGVRYKFVRWPISSP